MADVLVKDVAEIRLFSVGVQDFHERYESQLILVERAIDDDMATAKSLLGALENKVSQAASHLHSCQQALQSYLASQAGRKDSEGNPVPPDPDVVRRLTNAIHEAEARLARARRRYEEGKEECHKACVALSMAASATASGRGVVRDAVYSACSAIERAAVHIETYKG